MNWDAFAVASAFLVGAATIYISAHQITKQLKVAVFLDFTRRYADIVDRLPHDIRVAPFEAELSELSESDRAATEVAILSYFNLCSEEYYLHSEKFVTKRIWSLWLRGLRRSLEIPAVRYVWQEARLRYYADFRKKVDDYISATPPSGTSPGGS